MALNSIVNKTFDTVRGGLGQATRIGRDTANRGFGLGKRLANRGQAKDLDDVTLARKVETEIFRPANSPKGKVDVNAVEGVVWLRGEVKNQKQIAEIEAKVRSIPEVRGVENLLHLPKTPAPSRQRGGAKKTTTKRAASAKSSQSAKSGGQTKRFERAQTSEKPKATEADPLPTQAATSGEGRKAAPLGTKDTEAPATTTSESVTGGTTPTPAGNGGGSGTGSDS
jgi:hypothetical protein